MLSPIRRWHRFVEHLRFRCGPPSARALIRMSTFPAQRRLDRTTPLGVLVDNTVLYHAVTHETGWVSTGTKDFGDHKRGMGYAARVPVYPEESGSREYRNSSIFLGSLV